MVGEERESQEPLRYTYRKRRYLQRTLLLRSISMRLVHGRLKTFNYLYFFFVLGSYLLLTLASLVHLDFSLPLAPP